MQRIKKKRSSFIRLSIAVACVVSLFVLSGCLPGEAPPTGTLTITPTSITAGQSATLSWTSQNATSATISPDLGTEPVNGTATVSPSGTTTYTLTLAGTGGNATVQAVLTVLPPLQTNTPDVTVNLSGNTATITGNAGSVEAGAIVTISDKRTEQTATATVASDGRFSVPIAASGGDSLSITLADGAGTVSKTATVSVPAGLPPDPAMVAPAPDPTTATSRLPGTSFHYTGSSPVQTGGASGSIVAKRAAFVRALLFIFMIHGHGGRGRL